MNNNKACKHLHRNLDQEYIVRFTGINNELDLVCAKCAKRLKSNIQPDLYPLDAGRNSELKEYNWLECEQAIIGSMNLPDSNDQLRFESESISIKQRIKEKILALEPNPVKATQWFVLVASGQVMCLDIDVQNAHAFYRLDVGWVDLNEPVFMTVSADGRYLAIANVYRIHGEVIDTDTATQTMRLVRSDYHVEHCHFPLAFVQYKSKPLLIHATDWNHLDISDPATGKVIQDHPVEYDPDSDDDFNCAASFRGELMVSPDQNWIADNGWEWHPVGAVSSWSIIDWMETNCWEFISGPSMQNHTGVDYFWGQPMCWIDNTILCIWGWCVDDWHIMPAVKLFDVTTGERVDWFAGPEGALVFDGYLFSCTQDTGIAVWDVKEGRCLLQDKSVRARAYHPLGRYFIDYRDDGEWVIHRLSEESG